MWKPLDEVFVFSFNRTEIQSWIFTKHFWRILYIMKAAVGV